MKITDALLGEHGVLYSMFDRLETLAPASGDAAAVRAMATLLDAALAPHAEVENELLFAAMEASPDAERGPILAMREEHDAIEQALAEAADAVDAARGGALLRDTIAMTRDHFVREEHLLFPMAARMLGDDVLEELGAEWALRRHVALGEPARGVAP